MASQRILLTLILLSLTCPWSGIGAEGGGHELTPAPVELFKLGFFSVTNSMVAVWIGAAVIIGLTRLAMRQPKLVPAGLQNFWELVVEQSYEFLVSLLGNDLAKKTYWFFATVFFFILTVNWFGLLPGVGSFGWGVQTADGHFHLTEPWMRGATADVNMTAAMALLFFFLWVVWAVQSNGVGGVLLHIFPVKGHGSSSMAFFLVAVFVFVGLIEIISICIRPVALTFRLYGNVYAGENMIGSMVDSAGYWNVLFLWIVYCFELMVGLVQAFVFALLAAVFTMLICRHDGQGAH